VCRHIGNFTCSSSISSSISGGGGSSLVAEAITIIIQFNSIRVYLRANLRAQRPITKLARVHRNTDITKRQNTKYDSLYNGTKLIIIIPRKIRVSMNRRENKISTFRMIIPLCGEKGQYNTTTIIIIIFES
jgi:hypothetical protein